LAFALGFGGYHWARSAAEGVATPTGTIMITAVTLPWTCVVLAFCSTTSRRFRAAWSIARWPGCRRAPFVRSHDERVVCMAHGGRCELGLSAGQILFAERSGLSAMARRLRSRFSTLRSSSRAVIYVVSTMFDHTLRAPAAPCLPGIAAGLRRRSRARALLPERAAYPFAGEAASSSGIAVATSGS
jgi:hypothetical protein